MNYNDESIHEKWIRYIDLTKAMFSDFVFEDLLSLENDMLILPIATYCDAIIKLELVGLSLRDGERLDGADTTALRQTIGWLSAHFEAE
jgi:hypothetical protein